MEIEAYDGLYLQAFPSVTDVKDLQDMLWETGSSPSQEQMQLLQAIALGLQEGWIGKRSGTVRVPPQYVAEMQALQATYLRRERFRHDNGHAVGEAPY